MLNPLITPSIDWTSELPVQLDACAEVATSLKLAGFAKLAGHIARCLRRNEPAGKDKEFAGQWVARAIAFCSGQMVAGDPEELVSIVTQWKLVARHSNAGALDKLRARLVAESDRLVTARLRMGTNQIPLEPVTVAVDEMRMLSDACQDMHAALVRDDPETERALTDYAESILNAANALEHIGLRSLADLFRQLSSSIGDAVRAGHAIAATRTAALLASPQAWSQWFQHPVEVTLTQALSWHAQAVDADSNDSTNLTSQTLSGVRNDLSSLQVVRSRRITSQEVTEPEAELSLQIPPDADHEVVAQLVHELPVLAAQFSEAANLIVQGERDAVAHARRVAHTVKGAATTVGIVGIARLTHALEDLLQVIDDIGGSEVESLSEAATTIADGADCLAEMVDVVTGGSAQSSEGHGRVASVYQSVVELVQDLMPRDDDAPMGDSFGPGRSFATPDISDFELPDLELRGSEVKHPPGRPTPAQSTRRAAAATAKADVPGARALTERAEAPGRLPAPEASPAAFVPTAAAPGIATRLQVAAGEIDDLMESANEAVVTLSQMQEVISSTLQLRARWQRDSERLSQLTVELDRHLDAMPLPGPSPAIPDGNQDLSSLDPLEMERYGELHTASRRLSEVAADGKLLDRQLAAELARLAELAGKLEAMQGNIREGTLAIRLVDAQSIEPRLQRIARQAARLSGKLVDLQLDGGDTAVDGDLLQRLLEPLAHLVRNAVDHGLESSDERTRAGKKETGTVVVSFAREATNIRVVVRDDGAGLDIASIRRRAATMGLLPPGTELDATSVAQLVLAPGFSTRDNATQLSGRGIGLDVVTQALRGMRGELAISFEAGLGASFEISLPMQMSAVPVFIVRAPTHVVAVSIRGIEQILSPGDAQSAMRDGQRLTYANRILEVRRLDDALGLPQGILAKATHHQPGQPVADTPDVVAIVQTSGGGLTALLLPDPGQTRQVVVRGLPGALTHVPGVDGIAILADGAVAPVYDLPELIATSAQSLPDTRTARNNPVSDAPTCLLVDDSVSVRRATASLLSDLGLNVIDVADGREAMDVMATIVPTLVITDLEMPVMNGIELIKAVRAELRLKAVPVVMVTSRQSERHRRLALEAGADHFVTKPISEEQFAALINGLLG